MRACGYCAGILDWFEGEEAAARDQGGNATEKDTFKCRSCGRLFRHVVRERFEGYTEWWGVKATDAEPMWTDLPQAHWPVTMLGGRS